MSCVLGLAAQAAQGLKQPLLALRGRGISAVSHRHQRILGADGSSGPESGGEVVHAVFPLMRAAQHVIIRIRVVFRCVNLYRHMITLRKAADLFGVAGENIRREGVRPAAPQLDIVITKVRGVAESSFQRQMLISAGKKSEFHILSPWDFARGSGGSGRFPGQGQG